ncbi:hypothetical protein VNO80_01139 [Phaseolus coccineus]|uniref:Uncharacterized protein n=1 Tax=Phaseolus coccineus TaxID=3886 RepID=A0AAN9P5V8_PHACN
MCCFEVGGDLHQAFSRVLWWVVVMDVVEDDIDNDAGETLMLIERDAELIEVVEEVKIGVVEGLQRGFLLRSQVVDEMTLFFSFLGATVALVFSYNSIPNFSIKSMFRIVT